MDGLAQARAILIHQYPLHMLRQHMRSMQDSGRALARLVSVYWASAAAPNLNRRCPSMLHPSACTQAKSRQSVRG